MPVDQTPLFKARAKTIAQRQVKTEEEPRKEVTPNVLYKSLSGCATEIARNAADLAQLVHSRRLEYLSFNAPSQAMSESDRDRFDCDSEKAIGHLLSSIHQLASRVTSSALSSQEQKTHLLMITDVLANHVKATAKQVTHMRKLRVRSIASKQGTLRLTNLVEGARRRKAADVQETQDIVDEGMRRRVRPTHNGVSSDVKVSTRRESLTKSDGWEHVETSKVHDSAVDLGPSDDSSELPAPLRAQLMAENEKMMDKFSQVGSQVTSLESQIVEIQRLQETFAEKILDQEKDIDLINKVAVDTTENLVDGNEWIRQAISNSAGRRVVVLFCIIVITFTLLFLDWYNP